MIPKTIKNTPPSLLLHPQLSSITHIEALATRAARVHVLFNNCYRDYAQRNAADLRRLID